MGRTEYHGLLDVEHCAEIRVSAGLGVVCFEVEDWDGSERHTTRLEMDPATVTGWVSRLRQVVRVARARARDGEEVDRGK